MNIIFPKRFRVFYSFVFLSIFCSFPSRIFFPSFSHFFCILHEHTYISFFFVFLFTLFSKHCALFATHRFPGYGSFFDKASHALFHIFTRCSMWLISDQIQNMVERAYNSIRAHKQTRVAQRPVSKKTSSTMRETFG